MIYMYNMTVAKFIFTAMVLSEIPTLRFEVFFLISQQKLCTYCNASPNTKTTKR